MNEQVPVLMKRDTRAWQLQVWASFGVAVTLCAVGLAWLPGADIDRVFMIMGYVFCTSAAFALAKFVRDNERKTVDTPLFKGVVWCGFVVAMGLTGWGLWRMDVNPTYKSFLLVGWLFLISTVFTLAKTLRDKHEADLQEARLTGRAMAMAEERVTR